MESRRTVQTADVILAEEQADQLDLRALAHLIAAEEDVDVRSVQKRLNGERVKGPAGRRIDRALARHAIVPAKNERSGAAKLPRPLATKTDHGNYAESADSAQLR
jgi:hypothetical protein